MAAPTVEPAPRAVTRFPPAVERPPTAGPGVWHPDGRARRRRALHGPHHRGPARRRRGARAHGRRPPRRHRPLRVRHLRRRRPARRARERPAGAHPVRRPLPRDRGRAGRARHAHRDAAPAHRADRRHRARARLDRHRPALRLGDVALHRRARLTPPLNLASRRPTLPGVDRLLRSRLGSNLTLIAASAAVPAAVMHFFVSEDKAPITATEHLGVMAVGSTVAAVCSIALMLAGFRRRETRAVIAGGAFAAMTLILLIHGLATPGVLIGPNGIVQVAGGLALPAG